jgi:hypothetical protein
VDHAVDGYEWSTKDKVVTMSRFTFGFLLGAGAGWAVGSGKAAEWKRGLDDRRATGNDGAATPFAAPPRPATDSVNGITPEYTRPDVATL